MSSMTMLGFDFNVFTGLGALPDGTVVRLCYDFGFTLDERYAVSILSPAQLKAINCCPESEAVHHRHYPQPLPLS